MIIYKYPLPGDPYERITHDVPIDCCKIIHVGMDCNNQLSIWFSLEKHSVKEKRTFINIWTGSEYRSKDKIYIGTVNDGEFIHHIFEVKS